MIAAKTKVSSANRGRYEWLLAQFRSGLLGAEGHRLFDARIALPPGKTIEESIDLARRPFEPGSATIACWVPITRRRSKLTLTPCEPVNFPGYDAFKFGVHREPGHSFRWHVTEFSTGASVSGHCSTREAAIAKATARLASDRPKYFQRKLDSVREYSYQRPPMISASERQQYAEGG